MSKNIKLGKQAKQHYHEAWQLYLGDHYDEAREHLNKAIELEPDWAQPHLLFGQTYILQKKPDYKAAEREFRRVIFLDPTWDEGYYWLSGAFDEQGHLGKAIRALRYAMKLNPKDNRYPTSVGEYRMKQGKYRSAIKWFRRGIKLKPHYGQADYHLFLAEALLADNQLKAARKEWKFVLTLEPMYPSYKKTHKEAKRMLKKYPKTSKAGSAK